MWEIQSIRKTQPDSWSTLFLENRFRVFLLKISNIDSSFEAFEILLCLLDFPF